jgi:hypothetical protein
MLFSRAAIVALVLALAFAISVSAMPRSYMARNQGGSSSNRPCSASASPTPSSTPTGTPSAPYDTSCPSTYATRQGLLRAEPFKGRNLGHFSCSGSAITFDRVTGVQTSATDLPVFALSTLYNASCGCLVTVNDFSVAPIFEYINELPGRGLEGTCLNTQFYYPGSSEPVDIVGYARNVAYLHRDLVYLHPASGKLAGHQTLYLTPEGNEMVFYRLIDPETGVVVLLQNMVCRKLAAQP